METNSPISCLRKLFDENIKKFLSAEAELKGAIGTWISNEQLTALRMLLLDYKDLIGGHIERLNTLLLKEKITLTPVSNKVMLALISDTNEELSQCQYQEVKDACLLTALQNIIHWKIAFYGTVASFAKSLGMDGFASLFHQVVKDEKHFDERLTHLAKHEINFLAIQPLSQLNQ
ncbi:hypothetical protein D3C87_853180 [compost metagenome]